SGRVVSSIQIPQGPQQRLPRVAMRVDEAGHDDAIAGVHRFGVSRTEVLADLGYATVFEPHVGLPVVAHRRIEAENAPTADQELHARARTESFEFRIDAMSDSVTLHSRSRSRRRFKGLKFSSTEHPGCRCV